MLLGSGLKLGKKYARSEIKSDKERVRKSQIGKEILIGTETEAERGREKRE